jgi:hypothetical protein
LLFLHSVVFGISGHWDVVRDWVGIGIGLVMKLGAVNIRFGPTRGYDCKDWTGFSYHRRREREHAKYHECSLYYLNFCKGSSSS